MQTVTKVNSNMWRRAQGGLYAPVRRRFPINGLVLYAPLWHPELNTSPFISKDLNAHSCTVTGATWGIQGRTLNGTTNYITIADHASLRLTTAATFMFWVKLTNIDKSQYLFSKVSGQANYGGNFMPANTFRLGWFANAGWHLAESTGTVDTNWHQVVATADFALGSGQIKFYFDGAFDVARTDANTFEGTAEDAVLGCETVAGPGSPLDGIIGGAWFYNQALSAGEILNAYNSTKWRY